MKKEIHVVIVVEGADEDELAAGVVGVASLVEALQTLTPYETSLLDVAEFEIEQKIRMHLIKREQGGSLIEAFLNDIHNMSNIMLRGHMSEEELDDDYISWRNGWGLTPVITSTEDNIRTALKWRGVPNDVVQHFVNDIHSGSDINLYADMTFAEIWRDYELWEPN